MHNAFAFSNEFAFHQGELWSTLKLVIVLGFILLLLKMRRGTKKPAKAQDQDETRMIQEMYKGFERMEERVEALETLLLDKETKEKRK